MKILIGADIVPTASNAIHFQNGSMAELLDESLIRILACADYRIFNLEVPLTDVERPISKCGPNLIAPSQTVAGLKQIGIDFLTLANNHILDQGVAGMWSTAEQLDKAGIAYAGIGHTPEEAAAPHIRTIGDKRIGIYCCAEHEFSIVTDHTPGANPFDPLESLDHIAELRAQCDYVICLYHGGKEHYRYPSPRLQRVCRRIVEKGADLVVCQHSHCIGCEERYQGGTIIYGQGNFLFDHSESEFWKTSVLIRVDLSSGDIEYIPLQKNGAGVRAASEADAKAILDAMQDRSEQIKEPGFIEEHYSRFASEMITGYMMRDRGLYQSLPFRALNKLCGHRLGISATIRRIRRYGNAYINQYECEAHRELILSGVRNLANSREDAYE